MKITKLQQLDIDMCLYFCPKKQYHIPTEKEIRDFLDWSEKGIGKRESKFDKNPIVLGKSRRGLTMGMWEEGVLEGTVPYLTLLGGYANSKKWWQFWKKKHKPLPRYVVDFMKKEMFKGLDSDLIEDVYQQLINRSI